MGVCALTGEAGGTTCWGRHRRFVGEIEARL